MRTILVANRKGGAGKTLTAITVAAALAARGERVALADADPQKSAFRWLKRRPGDAPPIARLDWTSPKSLGNAPRKKADWVVVDAPGGLDGDDAQDLVARSHLLLVPLMPSWFDEDATKRFLRDLRTIKRIRKGRVEIHALANRVRPRSRATSELAAFCEDIGQMPLAWITERAAYGDLASQGLSVFDRPQKLYAPMRAQWQPVLDALAD